MLTLAHRVIKFVVLTQNMAKFTSIFSLANNFSVAAQPVSDEIMCQISHMYNLQSAEQITSSQHSSRGKWLPCGEEV